jgi:hypothetical protein
MRLPTPVNVKTFDGTSASGGPIHRITRRTLSFVKSSEASPHLSFEGIPFLVTRLPDSTPIILGFDFAEQSNLHVDWHQCAISFPEVSLRASHLSISEDEYLDPPSDLRPDWLDEIDYEPPAITKLKTLIPEWYHDYLDVFSKEKGESLPSHKDHDLRINLIEGSTSSKDQHHHSAAYTTSRTQNQSFLSGTLTT